MRGNKWSLSSSSPVTDKALAYLISVGIAGFGFWIVWASSGSALMWLAGSAPVAVGLLSLSNEIRNTP